MTGGVELGQFVVDVDGDGAEQADVFAAGRGDVGQQDVVDPAPLGPELGDGQPEVFDSDHTHAATPPQIRYSPSMSAIRVVFAPDGPATPCRRRRELCTGGPIARSAIGARAIVRKVLADSAHLEIVPRGRFFPEGTIKRIRYERGVSRRP